MSFAHFKGKRQGPRLKCVKNGPFSAFRYRHQFPTNSRQSRVLRLSVTSRPARSRSRSEMTEVLAFGTTVCEHHCGKAGPRSGVRGPRSEVRGPRSGFGRYHLTLGGLYFDEIRTQNRESEVQGPRSQVRCPDSAGPRSRVRGPSTEVRRRLVAQICKFGSYCSTLTSDETRNERLRWPADQYR